MSVSPPSLTLPDLKRLATTHRGKFNLFPIYRRLHADLETPVSAYLKVTQGRPYSFLLESVEGGEHAARYSYLGTEPYKLLRQDGVDPLIAIEAEMAQYKAYPEPTLPAFTGGGVGYISYDCIQYWEPKVNISSNNTLSLPDSLFLFCRALVIFDHVKHTAMLVAHVYLDDDQYDDSEVERLYTEATQRLDELVRRLQAPLPSSPVNAQHQQQQPSTTAAQPNGNSNGGAINGVDAPDAAHRFPVGASATLYSTMGQETYEAAVLTLQQHISRGDIIQAVPAHRCARKLQDISAFDLYRSLRVVNPSPYMFFLDLEEFHIVGASPEQLVKVEASGRVTTHPIAGTRRRGATEEEDVELEKDLLNDKKERAEHIMLVDLGRNDIGRIAKPGTVKVESLMHVERYSHVMHIVSIVSGQLASGKSAYDAFRSVFPAGTLSGAPKVRAMQLIAGLEGDHRGVYGGAVGYVSFTGVLDVAIAIRTLIVKGAYAYLQAGAGIVYDSVPLSEWEETLKKLGGQVKAIDEAEATAAYRGSLNGSDSFTDAIDVLVAQAKAKGIDLQELSANIATRYSR